MEPHDRSGQFRRLLLFLTPHRRRCVLALTFVAGFSVARLAPPLVFMYLVDEVIVGGRWGMLELLVCLALALPLITAGLSLGSGYQIGHVSQRLILDLRVRMYQHILRLSMRFREEMGTGRIMARIMDDVASVRMVMSRRLLRLSAEFISFWIAIVLCFGLNWKLTLVLLLALPLYVLNFNLFRGGLRSAWRRWRQKMDEVSAGLQERLSGTRLVKAYGREGRENRIFAEATRDGLGYAMQGAVQTANIETGVWAVSGLRNALVFCLGCYFVIEGEMSYGALMAFQRYSAMAFEAILSLTTLATAFERLFLSAGRIFEVLDWPVEIGQRRDAKPLRRLRGHVEFDHVWFEYNAGEPVLKDICLEVKPGQTVALVGQTGCGKTTLTRLLPRFFDVTAGSVSVDGHDVRDLQLKRLRREIGQVPQDTVMFNVSIRDNLSYGRSDATEDEMIEAARTAEIHDFILRTPDGYDTLLGEDGIKLSVGEKQRLAIARAVLARPAILILDEATSSLDSLSEASIQRAMATVIADRTSIVIAHRLSTVVNADLIVAMDHGEILETGTHAELLQRPKGLYRRLYQQQFGETAEDETVAEGST